jgi:hypothetical protein
LHTASMNTRPANREHPRQTNALVSVLFDKISPVPPNSSTLS